MCPWNNCWSSAGVSQFENDEDIGDSHAGNDDEDDDDVNSMSIRHKMR